MVEYVEYQELGHTSLLVLRSPSDTLAATVQTQKYYFCAAKLSWWVRFSRRHIPLQPDDLLMQFHKG